MSDDFLKRGVPSGMSAFAKIGITFAACLMLYGLFVGYRVHVEFAAITEAVEKTWVQIAEQDPAVQNYVVNAVGIDHHRIWGVPADIVIENREIWFHEASSLGSWIGPDGQRLSFEMLFAKGDDGWLLSEIGLAEQLLSGD